MTTGMIDTFKSRVNEGGGLALANLYRVFLPPCLLYTSDAADD